MHEDYLIFSKAHGSPAVYPILADFDFFDKDKSKDELFDYLRTELDEILKAEKKPKYFRRTMQDFYFLWYFISEINFEMIKFYRIEIKYEIKQMFNYLKNIPDTDWKENRGMSKFKSDALLFKAKYKIDQRKIILSEKDKLKLIHSQKNESN